MKKLIILMLLVVSLQAMAQGVVQCALNNKGKPVPVNDIALAIAKKLNVSTCTGERFVRFGRMSGYKYQLIKMTPEAFKAYDLMMFNRDRKKQDKDYSKIW